MYSYNAYWRTWSRVLLNDFIGMATREYLRREKERKEKERELAVQAVYEELFPVEVSDGTAQ